MGMMENSGYAGEFPMSSSPSDLVSHASKMCDSYYMSEHDTSHKSTDKIKKLHEETSSKIRLSHSFSDPKEKSLTCSVVNGSSTYSRHLGQQAFSSEFQESNQDLK